MWWLLEPGGSGGNPAHFRSPRHLESVDGVEVDRVLFLRAMSRTAAGVNVVTTDGPSGRFGVTVTAFASVSADPPMVLVCIHRRSPICGALERNEKFCINVLSAGQRRVADTFSGHPRRGAPYDFACGAWVANASGTPRLIDACAALDCELENAHDSGSHTIFVGRVIATATGSASPLLYCSRSYGAFTLAT